MQQNLQLKIENEIHKIVKKASDVEIVTDEPLDDIQIVLLKELNNFSVSQTLYDEEVQKDPRKILYKTNQILKESLVALCLTQVMINKRSKGYYTKEYFDANIDVSTVADGVKKINFGKCESSEVLAAINEEKVFDWILYCQGRGIEAFVMEKTDCRGIEGFVPGGKQTYEFARFEKLSDEEKRRKQAIEKEALQLEFKQSFLRELAIGMAQKQIDNPQILDIVKSIFEKENYMDAIGNFLHNEPLEKTNEFSSITNEKQKLLTVQNSKDFAQEFLRYELQKQKQKSR
ncbi:MAG: hypothetical protein IJF12_05150 [Alphaproteobacteria bacterium]|nr:hypothetical protein [Alphaproteobacteria bacterium]